VRGSIWLRRVGVWTLWGGGLSGGVGFLGRFDIKQFGISEHLHNRLSALKPLSSNVNSKMS